VRCFLKGKIRQIVKSHAHLGVDLDSLKDSSDLYEAGMTSHSSVVLMLALENEFGVEFPSSLLSRSVFESIDSIATAVEDLVPAESR
jgi:acyl carrier protein